MFQGVIHFDLIRFPVLLARVTPSINPLRETMKSIKKLISSSLIVCLTAASLPFGAQARIVSTEEVTAPAISSTSRDTVNRFLARDDVRQAMLGQGVSIDAATQRVAAMSDAEVAQLAGRVEQAPAGGDVLGILFTVFIVLLVTDIMGLTKVFPFTRSVR
jgi:hypothetical protein